MFFENVYNSWKPKQFEKYSQLAAQLDIKKLFHGKHVLDIACGPCWFEEFLAKQEIDVSNFIAVDKSLKHLLERTARIHALCVDAESLHIKDKFDVVIALDCLHLFDFNFKKYLKNETTSKKRAFVLASLFFNNQNLIERKNLLKKKLKGLKIVKEIIVQGEESEIFLLAMT